MKRSQKDELKKATIKLMNAQADVTAAILHYRSEKSKLFEKVTNAKNIRDSHFKDFEDLLNTLTKN